MRLSDAIRLGAMLHPQCFGALNVMALETQRVLRTCALGAAEEAGYDTSPLRENLFLEARAQCPAGCMLTGQTWLRDTITHLNDDHRWTREQIADWVASIERREESAAVDASDPHVTSTGTLTTRDKAFSSSS